MGTGTQEAAQAVETMKAYINAHLSQPITARDIANAAGYSQFYAARIFKQATGLSPYEYLRQQRLVGAAHALRRGGVRVIDVALDFVFDSHAGFTRAFTKAFCIPPKQFSAFPTPTDWLIPYRGLPPKNTTLEVSELEQKTAVIFTQIVERPRRKLLLCRSKRAQDYFS